MNLYRWCLTQYNQSQNDVSRNKKWRLYFQKFPGSFTGESTHSRENIGSQDKVTCEFLVWQSSSVLGCEVVQEGLKFIY